MPIAHHRYATVRDQQIFYREIHLLDGGHFLLESAGDQAAELIRDFLGRVTATR